MYFFDITEVLKSGFRRQRNPPNENPIENRKADQQLFKYSYKYSTLCDGAWHYNNKFIRFTLVSTSC